MNIDKIICMTNNRIKNIKENHMDLVYLSVFVLESESPWLCRRIQIRLNFVHFSTNQVGFLILTQGYLNMKTIEVIEAQAQEY